MNERILMTQRKRKILNEECLAHGVAFHEVMGRSRKQPIAKARQSAMRRLRMELGLSLMSIGQYMNRDHTTVLHALRQPAPETRSVRTYRGWNLWLPE
mgnify:CR=1 FL=1